MSERARLAEKMAAVVESARDGDAIRLKLPELDERELLEPHVEKDFGRNLAKEAVDDIVADFKARLHAGTPG